jgi:hypothetical protein
MNGKIHVSARKRGVLQRSAGYKGLAATGGISAPDPEWAVSNPERFLAWLYVTHCDCPAFDAFLNKEFAD